MYNWVRLPILDGRRHIYGNRFQCPEEAKESNRQVESGKDDNWRVICVRGEGRGWWGGGWGAVEGVCVCNGFWSSPRQSLDSSALRLKYVCRAAFCGCWRLDQTVCWNLVATVPSNSAIATHASWPNHRGMAHFSSRLCTPQTESYLPVLHYCSWFGSLSCPSWPSSGVQCRGSQQGGEIKPERCKLAKLAKASEGSRPAKIGRCGREVTKHVWEAGTTRWRTVCRKSGSVA